MVLGAAAKTVGATVTAIDPFVEGKLFGGPATRGIFEQNIMKADLDGVVSLRPVPSDRARAQWAGTVDLLYIDGKHDVWTFSDDLRWRAFLRPGASVLVHDAFSSIGVTLGVLLRVLPSADLTYVRRTGSMALSHRRRPSLGDRLRILRELPWWVRNVGLKVLLRLRLRPLARLLGHDSPYDPY